MTATVSSVTQDYVAANLTDGNSTTYWESANNAFPQWASVSLGSTSTIGRVVLTLPPSWSTRTQTLSIDASSDGVTFTPLITSASYTFDPATANTVAIALSATSLRAVRLDFTANTGWPAAQLSEIQIYGP
jgi:hypothetical protein